MKKRDLLNEYSNAALGDRRRSARLLELVSALADDPGASLPTALGEEAALEGAYRFLGNESVSPAAILLPHCEETAQRCRERGEVVVAHDTTDFTFPGEKRRGLGRIRGTQEQGFLSHVALAVSWDDQREPLGVVAHECWVRGACKPEKISARQRQKEPSRESQRWHRGVENAGHFVDPRHAVHVMDREADAYDLMAAMVAAGERFVIRATFDRCVIGSDELMSHALASQPVVVTRDVPLSARKQALLPQRRKIHPARMARVARLGIRAVSIALKKPRGLPAALPSSLGVCLVAVEEIAPPAGEPAVRWWLFTTEPIETAAAVERVVDAYRCRWRIEEYFKALKTGCAIEKRQLETLHSLTNVLAVSMPIAWRVLRHRTLAQTNADAPATTVLSALQLRLLRRKSRKKLSGTLTVEKALLAVAALGGHLKRNGAPGWITLSRGYERLLAMEEGALLVLGK
jgi:hypothetical protein